MSKRIIVGAKTNKDITCSNCGKSIPAGEQFTFKGRNGEDLNVCADCKILIDQELAKGTKDIPFGKAILGGLAGALLGALLWFLIEFFTGYQIGYVAIGVAYLILKGIGIG